MRDTSKHMLHVIIKDLPAGAGAATAASPDPALDGQRAAAQARWRERMTALTEPITAGTSGAAGTLGAQAAGAGQGDVAAGDAAVPQHVAAELAAALQAGGAGAVQQSQAAGEAAARQAHEGAALAAAEQAGGSEPMEQDQAAGQRMHAGGAPADAQQAGGADAMQMLAAAEALHAHVGGTVGDVQQAGGGGPSDGGVGGAAGAEAEAEARYRSLHVGPDTHAEVRVTPDLQAERLLGSLPMACHSHGTRPVAGVHAARDGIGKRQRGSASAQLPPAVRRALEGEHRPSGGWPGGVAAPAAGAVHVEGWRRAGAAAGLHCAAPAHAAASGMARTPGSFPASKVTRIYSTHNTAILYVQRHPPAWQCSG